MTPEFRARGFRIFRSRGRSRGRPRSGGEARLAGLAASCSTPAFAEIRAAALLVTESCAIVYPLIGHHAEAEAPKKLSHEWREVMENHWQIVSSGEAPRDDRRRRGTRGACTPVMVEVKGKMRVTAIGDELQKATCTNWINREFPERCASSRRKMAGRARQAADERHALLHRPLRVSQSQGRVPARLRELVRGEDGLQERRQASLHGRRVDIRVRGRGGIALSVRLRSRQGCACITDRPWRAFDPKAYPGTETTLVAELDKALAGRAVGNAAALQGGFGVYDMTGNVDEWTQSSIAGRKSILKGAAIGVPYERDVVHRRAHMCEAHVFYQQGLRCL